MVKEIQQESRLVWLDWMKVLAILSIIWGHFFSAGHLYLYVFSVQVFCIISGFLWKKSPNWKICLQKCFWQLFVPTVIMSIIMQLEAYLRCFALGQDYGISWSWFFEWLLLGHRWCMGPCWYFYTLIIMRILMQLLPQRWWVYLLTSIVIASGAVVFQHFDYEISNANVNVLVCMPLFLIGVLIKPLKSWLCGLHNNVTEVILLLTGAILVYMCGRYNGYVWMYLCGYGHSFLLYVIGAMAGLLVLFVVSVWLGRLPYRQMVLTLSKGSILIIGLHIIIVRRLTELSDRLWGEDLLLSVVILFCFVPIIRLVEIFFPILLGRYRK